MEDLFLKFLREVFEGLKDLREEIPKAVEEKLESVELWHQLPPETRKSARKCGSCRHFHKPSCPYFKFSDVIVETDPPCLDYESEKVEEERPEEEEIKEEVERRVRRGELVAREVRKLKGAHRRRITRVKVARVKKITKNGLVDCEVRYVLTLWPMMKNKGGRGIKGEMP